MTAGYADAWAAVNRLIREGKSWSGREPNCAYLNLGDGTFADVSFTSGIGFPDDARAFAMVDWDDDGDQDFWIVNRTAPRVRFVRNESPGGNRFASFHLTGRKCNRDAIGARIDVKAGVRRLVRILDAGSGYLSQSAKTVHFGVGKAERLDEVVVRWPDGAVQRFEGVETNRRYALAQGDAALTVVERRADPAASKLAPSTPQPIKPTEVARIALTARVALPAMRATDHQGGTHALGGKQPVLVTFWASTCPSCLGELSAWTKARKEIEGAALKILALSVDAPPGDGAADPARDALARLGFPFPAGAASDEWIQTFDLVQRAVLDRQRRMPVPTSFLVDGEGRLAYVYKGPVSAERLAADVGNLKLDDVAFAGANAPFEGRWTKRPGQPHLGEAVRLFLDRGALAMARFYLDQARAMVGPPGGAVGPAQRQLGDALMRAGIAFLEAGRRDEAEAVLRQSIEYDTENASAWLLLGQSAFEREKVDEAEKHFRRATEIDPSYAHAWSRLGSALLVRKEAAPAREAYERAIAADPNLSEAWVSLGLCHVTSQEFDKGLSCFRKVVELQPGLSLGWTGLGTCLAMTGDAKGAIPALERAVSLDPKNERASALLQELRRAQPPTGSGGR